MRIIALDDCKYLEDCNLFTSRKWLDLLREEYRFTFKAVVDGEEGNPLIFSEISDIFGDRIVSLPFCDYTEPVVGTEKLPAVFGFLRETYSDRTIIIRLHGELEDAERLGYRSIRTAVCHRVPLNGEMEDIWKRTTYAFRKGVNKAKANKLRVERMNSRAGVDIFYAMLTRLRKNKFHIIPQAKSFYLRMLDSFVKEGEGDIWVVFREELPLAAAVVLRSGNALFDKMGVSDEEYLHLRPNNILLSEIMTYGNAIGYDYLDMGLSQSDYTGLLSFKDSLGGIRTPINFYKYTPENYDTRREKEIKDLLSRLSGIFVNNEMPDDVVQQAAGILYKYFC